MSHFSVSGNLVILTGTVMRAWDVPMTVFCIWRCLLTGAGVVLTPLWTCHGTSLVPKTRKDGGDRGLLIPLSDPKSDLH